MQQVVLRMLSGQVQLFPCHHMRYRWSYKLQWPFVHPWEFATFLKCLIPQKSFVLRNNQNAKNDHAHLVTKGIKKNKDFVTSCDTCQRHKIMGKCKKCKIPQLKSALKNYSPWEKIMVDRAGTWLEKYNSLFGETDVITEELKLSIGGWISHKLVWAHHATKYLQPNQPQCSQQAIALSLSLPLHLQSQKWHWVHKMGISKICQHPMESSPNNQQSKIQWCSHLTNRLMHSSPKYFIQNSLNMATSRANSTTYFSQWPIHTVPPCLSQSSTHQQS